jgi:nucleoside-diphosphate-sugar epimerase
MTTINPPYVYGPSLEPHIASPSSIGGTQQLWWNQVVDIPSEGLTKEALGIKGGNTWVDVRDLAEAHVRALEREGAGGERIIVSGGKNAFLISTTCTDAVTLRRPVHLARVD